MSRCIVEDCDSHDPLRGCMVSHNNDRFGPIACEYGRFVTDVTKRFGCFGEWKFRSTENAKLRELVLVLKNCADENGDCYACPINDAKPVRHPWFGCDALRDMMRDLGVEVDG